MGDYSDEDALIEVQLPDTTQDPGRDGKLGGEIMTDAARLSWSMTEAEMIKLAEKEEQDLLRSSGMFTVFILFIFIIFLADLKTAQYFFDKRKFPTKEISLINTNFCILILEQH